MASSGRIVSMTYNGLSRTPVAHAQWRQWGF